MSSRTLLCNGLLVVLLPFLVPAADEPLDLSLGAEMDSAIGLDWPAPDGGIVHLRIIEKQFHLFFLDAERKIVEPPVSTAMLRGEETRNTTNNIVRQLRRGSGPFLIHPRHQFPPYDYWLRIILPSASGDEAENVTLPRTRFRQ